MKRDRRAASVMSMLVLVVLTGCGLQTDSGSGSGGEFEASNVEFVVHTGPGGGSDIFARDVISLLRDEEIISENWPVRNEEAGEGAGAMSYLAGESGQDNTISATTTTWLTTPLTIEGAEVKIQDLTPVAGLIIEPEVMTVVATRRTNRCRISSRTPRTTLVSLCKLVARPLKLAPSTAKHSPPRPTRVGSSFRSRRSVSASRRC